MITAEEAKELSNSFSVETINNTNKYLDTVRELTEEFISVYVASDIKANASKHGAFQTYFTSDELKRFLRKKGFRFYETVNWKQGWDLSPSNQIKLGLNFSNIHHCTNHPIDDVFISLKESLEKLGYTVSNSPKLGTLRGYKQKQGWNTNLSVRWR